MIGDNWVWKRTLELDIMKSWGKAYSEARVEGRQKQ